MSKNVEEIYARLFNHHPVISGEIKYFLKEFEEQRKDREIESLFQILEKTTSVRENDLEKLRNYSDVHLGCLTEYINTALSTCDRIMEKEKQFEENDWLSRQRQNRVDEEKTFKEDMARKRVNVDVTFAERERQTRDNFQELEEKLSIKPLNN